MNSLCKPAVTRTSEPKLLEAPKARSTYRRSTTCKAPRKRTFIANMTKVNPLFYSAGVGGSMFTTEAASVEIMTLCTGGIDGGNKGNVRCRTGGSGDDDNNNRSGSGSSRFQQGAPRAVVVGAAALMAALVFMPGEAAASKTAYSMMISGHVSVGPATLAMEPAAVAARSKKIGNMCISSTPTTTTAGGAKEGAIVYGEVALSEAERRMLANRQLYFRETLRTEALKI